MNVKGIVNNALEFTHPNVVSNLYDFVWHSHDLYDYENVSRFKI